MFKYQLMNKDNLIATYIAQKDLDNIRLAEDNVQGQLPIGYQSMDKWLSERNAAKHNKHLRALMNELGGNQTDTFIVLTHAASINDTFWIRREDENYSWSDISLYSNEFSDVISRLAFEGYGIPAGEFSSTSPELTTDGSFRKCFRKENGDIFMYKRGHNEGRNAGLEPYCEVLSSQFTSRLCPNAVRYDIVKLHNETASKCKLFTNEQVGHVSAARIFSDQKSFSDQLAFYAEHDCEDEFRRMLVCDSVLFNVDRHAGNYGMLIDNATQQYLGFAPVFDLNLALLPYVEQPEFDHLGDKLLEMGPKIGTDFVRLGQTALTDGIRKDLWQLKDFEFDFAGCEMFPKERVDILNRILQKQISAVLSHEIVHTKDVFVPEQYYQKMNRYQQAKAAMNKFLNILDKSALPVEYSVTDDPENVTVYLEFTLGNTVIEIALDFINQTSSCETDGVPTTFEDLSTDHPDIFKRYTSVMDCVIKAGDQEFAWLNDNQHISPVQSNTLSVGTLNNEIKNLVLNLDKQFSDKYGMSPETAAKYIDEQNVLISAITSIVKQLGINPDTLKDSYETVIGDLEQKGLIRNSDCTISSVKERLNDIYSMIEYKEISHTTDLVR